MSESFLVGMNSHYTLEPPWFVGQSFRPTESHKLNFIDLRVRRFTPGGELFCTVHDLAIDPNMTAGGISTAKSTHWPRAWPWQFIPVRFTMRPANLFADHDYALALRAEPAPAWNKPDIACRVDTGFYPRGQMFTKESALSPPVYRPNDDLMFAEYGEPPTPPPTPLPPFLEWILTDIKQTKLSDGYKIVVATNVPVHLWLRWSTKKPWIHRVPRLRRGTFVWTDFYYCFTVFTDLEQIEAGDTLYHTFEMHDWPSCQTRWFYFYGTVDNVPSPSTSPLFDKHFLAPEGISVICWPTEQWGWANAPATMTWSTAWNHPGNWVWNVDYYHRAGAAQDTSKYWSLERGMFYFDTSPIPPGKKVIAAKLRIYWCSEQYMTGGGRYWVPTTAYIVSAPDGHYPMIASDFGYLRTCTDIIGERYFPVHRAYETDDFELTPAQAALIPAAGIAKFGLRVKCDLDNAPPPRLEAHNVISRSYISPDWLAWLEVRYV